jgi:ATP-binding protein involved in chromosome partitioning
MRRAPAASAASALARLWSAGAPTSARTGPCALDVPWPARGAASGCSSSSGDGGGGDSAPSRPRLPPDGPGLGHFLRRGGGATGRPPPPPPTPTPLPGMAGPIIAISSGKGGVGKSTVAANLAAALAARSLKIGLLDADVAGPSVPTMLGLDDGRKPDIEEGSGLLIPRRSSHGVFALSTGFLLPRGGAAVWRGPMVMSALGTLTRRGAWSGLDALVVDLPPGTGDAHLSIAQALPLAGAVVVTTPGAVALSDAARGAAMWSAAGVRVLGVVENMAGYACPACGHRDDVFGAGGGGEGQGGADSLGLPILGRVPLVAAVRAGGDAGAPVVVSDPASPAGVALTRVAAAVAAAVGLGSGGGGGG